MLFDSRGMPVNSSGGATFCPSHVYFIGIFAPSANAGELTRSAIMSSDQAVCPSKTNVTFKLTPRPLYARTVLIPTCLGSANCSPAQLIGNRHGNRPSGARIRMSIPRQTPHCIDVNERVRQSGVFEDSASQGPFNWLLGTKLRHDDQRRGPAGARQRDDRS